MPRSARDRVLDAQMQREAMSRLQRLDSRVRFDSSGFVSTHTESRVRIATMPDFLANDAQRALGTVATVLWVGDHSRTRQPEFWLVVPNQRAWRLAGVSRVVGAVGRLGLVLLLMLRLLT